MTKYTEEFKQEMVKKMLPPNGQLASKLSRESGVGKSTLYKWRRQYGTPGSSATGSGSKSDNWSGETKICIVIETAHLNASELSEYCRKKGLYIEQISAWKEAAILGNARKDQLDAVAKQRIAVERKKVIQLERELHRKEKALAEAAALLILSKKAQAIWGEYEEE